MQLHEANNRLKTKITDEQLWEIHTIYCLLDLDKDEFCKIVDVVGVEALASRKGRYERLAKGKDLLESKERYEQNLNCRHDLEAKMQALQEEQIKLESEISSYIAKNIPLDEVSHLNYYTLERR